MIEAIQSRLQDLIDVLTKAKAILKKADSLPAFAVMRLALAIDSATVQIQGHLGNVQGAKPQPAPELSSETL